MVYRCETRVVREWFVTASNKIKRQDWKNGPTFGHFFQASSVCGRSWRWGVLPQQFCSWLFCFILILDVRSRKKNYVLEVHLSVKQFTFFQLEILLMYLPYMHRGGKKKQTTTTKSFWGEKWGKNETAFSFMQLQIEFALLLGKGSRNMAWLTNSQCNLILMALLMLCSFLCGNHMSSLKILFPIIKVNVF